MRAGGSSPISLRPHIPVPHWALVFLLFTLLLLFRLRSRPHLAWLTDPLAWVAYLGMGFFTVCSTLLVLRDTGGLLFGLVLSNDAGLNAGIDAATFLLAFAVAGYGFYPGPTYAGGPQGRDPYR